METRFGDGYRELKRRTWMFLPGEPGGVMQQKLLGWIHHPKARLAASYVCSLIAVVGLALLARDVSLAAIHHTLLQSEKIAAIAFVPVSESDLCETVRSAMTEGAKSAKIENGWVLAQIMRGQGPVVHTLIDAGMTHQQAKGLDLAQTGMKLIFSKQETAFHRRPFSALIQWRPVAIVEVDRTKASKVIQLDSSWFSGNPVMPIF